MNEETIVLLILPSALIVGISLGVINYRSRLRKARHMLDDWASREKLSLISAQPRHIRCGPFRFRGSKAQQVFHILVKTESGSTREGFALCGGTVMGLMTKSVKVHWNN